MKKALLWTTTALALFMTGPGMSFAQDATKPAETVTGEAAPAADETLKKVEETVQETTEKAAEEVQSEPTTEPVVTEEPKTDEAQAEQKTEEPASAAEEKAAEEKPAETTVETPAPETAAPAQETAAPATKEASDPAVAKEAPAAEAPAVEQAPAAASESAPASTETPATTQPPAAAEAPATPAPAANAPTNAGGKAQKRKPDAAASTVNSAPPAASTPTAQPATQPENPPAPAVVVDDNQTAAQQAAAAEAEKVRRKEARKRRQELIGAGIAGVAVGAVIGGKLGGTVVGDEGDRVIVERDGRYFVRKDENNLLRRDGSEIITEDLSQGRQRTTVVRPDGVEIITLRDDVGNILKRSRRFPNGDEVVLIDNQDPQDFERRDYRRELGDIRVGIPRERYIMDATQADRRALRETLIAEPVERVERAYSLREIRESERLRAKTRRIDLDNINFLTGSANITRSQIEKLDDLGNAIADIIRNDPDEVFLVEGHTDAVGSEISNLTLSDRRAETVARVLVEIYKVPPENLVVEGYGEQNLKVQTQEANQDNRRVTLRRITPLLRNS